MTDIISGILRREGGFVDHPADRGGPTNFGITLGTLAEWRGTDATRDDVEALTEQEAREIYQALYVTRPGFDGIADAHLRAQVIDSGVLHGTGRAARWLQQAAGVGVDGAVGPITLGAVNGADADMLGRKFAVTRIRKIGRIVSRDHSQAVFALGWLRRATEFLLPEDEA